jgi:hypothetical protein
MTLYEGCSKITSFINDSKLTINATLISEINNEAHYELELNSNGFVSITFHISINKLKLIEKIDSNTGTVIPKTENSDIQEFIIRKNIELLPYLKEYTNIETDYDKLALLYYNSRGTIIGKRFGF